MASARCLRVCVCALGTYDIVKAKMSNFFLLLVCYFQCRWQTPVEEVKIYLLSCPK